MKLSIVVITKNAGTVLEDALKSVAKTSNEIILVDDNSTDNTLEIAKKFEAEIYKHHEPNLGKQKAFAIKKTSNPWVLILDSDERISKKLASEIKKTLSKKTTYTAFKIPYLNHFLGKPIKYGGENYKMIRLFNKKASEMTLSNIHEHIMSNNSNVGILKNKILHYSYRSLPQMFSKFTDYGIREAKQKNQIGEKVTFSKLFLYAPHMFYARFIKDKGYKDGLFRVPLDLGFAYMELVTYWSLLFMK